MKRKISIDYEKLNALLVKFNELTDREFEIAKLLNKQLSSKAIGELLSISPHTVDCHRRKIISKLNISDTRSLQFLKIRK